MCLTYASNPVLCQYLLLSLEIYGLLQAVDILKNALTARSS